MFRIVGLFASIALLSGCSGVFVDKSESPQSKAPQVVSTTENFEIKTNKVEDKIKAAALKIESGNSVEEKNSDYTQAKILISKGKTQEAETLLQKNASFHTPSNKLLKRLEAPFSLALKSVEDYLQAWLEKPTEVDAIAFDKPTYPVIPLPPVPKAKGEFESTKKFNIRLAQTKQAYQNKLDAIKAKYSERVKVYNSAVAAYNNEIYWEQERRKEQVISMRSRLLNVAISELLGEAKLINVLYNADKEVFNARVVAADNTVHYDIVIPVVLSKAQVFKYNADKSKVFVNMNLKGEIKPIDFKIQNSGDVYTAYLSNGMINTSVKLKDINAIDVDLKSIQVEKTKDLKVDTILEDNKEFFRTLEVDGIVKSNKKYFRKQF
jgi:hypothetical protein